MHFHRWDVITAFHSACFFRGDSPILRLINDYICRGNLEHKTTNTVLWHASRRKEMSYIQTLDGRSIHIFSVFRTKCTYIQRYRSFCAQNICSKIYEIDRWFSNFKILFRREVSFYIRYLIYTFFIRLLVLSLSILLSQKRKAHLHILINNKYNIIKSTR